MGPQQWRSFSMTALVSAVALAALVGGLAAWGPGSGRVKLEVAATTTSSTERTSTTAAPSTTAPTSTEAVSTTATRATPSSSKAAVTKSPTTKPPAPPTSSPPAAPSDAGFEATISVIDAAIASRMQASWRPGCPVPLDQLRLVTITHWGFDDQPHRGELVVAADHADAIVAVFRTLYSERFPIQQVRLVDEYGGDDDRSMAANNTSAFNCRQATGSSSWSEHAYGRAIDINPVQNPYVTRSGTVLPPEGAPFTNRRASAPGLITANGPVVAAFRSIGWGWGGSWSGTKDYQHFSSTGR